jgi:hypothetical protein
VLKRDSLPDATRRVFDHLAANALVRDFTLIGGSALALQFGHRHSDDPQSKPSPLKAKDGAMCQHHDHFVIAKRVAPWQSKWRFSFLERQSKREGGFPPP